MGYHSYSIHITKAFDDKCKRLFVVAHTTEEEDHLGNEIPFCADIIRLIDRQNKQETEPEMILPLPNCNSYLLGESLLNVG